MDQRHRVVILWAGDSRLSRVLHPNSSPSTSDQQEWTAPTLCRWKLVQRSENEIGTLREASQVMLSKDLVLLASSVSSTRTINWPPVFFAKSQLKSAVLAPPTWRVPVGLGANLTRTGDETDEDIRKSRACPLIVRLSGRFVLEIVNALEVVNKNDESIKSTADDVNATEFASDIRKWYECPKWLLMWFECDSVWSSQIKANGVRVQHVEWKGQNQVFLSFLPPPFPSTYPNLFLTLHVH